MFKKDKMLGKDFKEDHMIFRGNGGKSVVANRV